MAVVVYAGSPLSSETSDSVVKHDPGLGFVSLRVDIV